MRSDPRRGSRSREGRPRPRRRHAARGMRRLRHFRPPGRRRHHCARPARPAASRPGGRRHRGLRRPRFHTDATWVWWATRSGGGDHRAPARAARPSATSATPRPANHPPQRPADVRRSRGRRLRGRPQWQPDQLPDAAPQPGLRRSDLPVDLRHRGDPPSGRALPQAGSSSASSTPCRRSRAAMRWWR